MPRRSLTNIAHSALTDHRIPRMKAAADPMPLAAVPAGAVAAIRETRPAPNPGDRNADELRPLALAYAQLAPNYRPFAEPGFALLQRASEVFPDDPEVQATYGLVLLAARPGQRALAESVLQRAVNLGSQSVEVRLRLGQLQLDQGNVGAAIAFYADAVRLAPFFLPAPYLRLARAYRAAGDSAKAQRH